MGGRRTANMGREQRGQPKALVCSSRWRERRHARRRSAPGPAALQSLLTPWAACSMGISRLYILGVHVPLLVRAFPAQRCVALSFKLEHTDQLPTITTFAPHRL